MEDQCNEGRNLSCPLNPDSCLIFNELQRNRLDQFISTAGEDVLLFHSKRNETKFEHTMEQETLFFYGKIISATIETPLYEFRSNQNLYLFFFYIFF